MSEIALRDYFERRIDDLSDRLVLQIAAVKAEVDKTERLQQDYNRTHNDLQRKLDTERSALRIDLDARVRIADLPLYLADLRRAVAVLEQSSGGAAMVNSTRRADISLIVSVVAVVASLIIGLWKIL